jgi:hypothetical protein
VLNDIVAHEDMLPTLMALRLPKLFNLRSDPFETADHEGMDYSRWRIEQVFLLVPAQQYAGQFLATFKEFPPRPKPGASRWTRCWKRSSRAAPAKAATDDPSAFLARGTPYRGKPKTRCAMMLRCTSEVPA